MRVLPDQIRIALVERKPVAFTRQGQQIGLVDASGVLLSMPAAAMAKHHYSFPVLTGIDPGDPLASRSARMAVYERLLAELDASNQHLSDQISEIDLTDPEDARVLMPEQGADILAHLGQDHFLERYQRYKAHIGRDFLNWRRWTCASTGRTCWRWRMEQTPQNPRPARRPPRTRTAAPSRPPGNQRIRPILRQRKRVARHPRTTQQKLPRTRRLNQRPPRPKTRLQRIEQPATRLRNRS